MSFADAFIIKGNSKSRNPNDYYPTAPLATKCLFGVYGNIIPSKVWEPAAGRGWMSKEIIATGRECVSTDLFEYDSPLVPIETGVDYLKSAPRADCVITNPPYKKDLAQKFAEKAISESVFCAMFLRLTFMEGTKRLEMFRKTPPTVMVMSGRVSCDESHFGDYKKQQWGMVAYAWYVWGKDVEPGRIFWVNPKDYIPRESVTLEHLISA